MTYLDPMLKRRTVLGGALSIGALAAGTTLSGCRTNKNTPTEPKVNDVTLPDFVEYEGVKPDLPATAEGAPSGFFAYPEDPKPSVTEPPLDGASMTLMTNIFSSLPTPKGQNAAWQAVEKGLGGTFDITIVPASDYSTKFQTTIAGNKMPDAMLLDSSTIDDLPRFLDATCADLTPFLSGEKVRDFPNLAAIPTIAWEQCVHGNRIFGLPIPRGITGGAGFVNTSILEEAGASMPTSIDDYFDVCKEINAPKQNQYAIINQKGNTFLIPLYLLHGVPNSWRLEGDTLTKSYETEEYAATLEFGLKLAKAGFIVPGSDGIDGQTRKNYFKQRKAAFVYDGLPAMPDYRKSMQGQDVQPYVPAGDKALVWADNIVFGQTVLKKADDERIRQLLATANYFAAPFGTAEHLLINFGVEGVDHERKNGVPTLTPKGEQELTAPWKYFVAPKEAIFDPDKDYVKAYHEAVNTMVPMAVPNPVANITSPTEDELGSKINKALTDVRDDILAGRAKMSAWEPAVEKWRKDGGDKIRDEYEQALAAA